MPAVSKKQFAFMKDVEEGHIHPQGLSPQKAQEFTQGVHPSKLPRYANLKKKLKKQK